MEVINSLISSVAAIISLAALIRGRKNSQKLIELEEVHAQLSRKQLEGYEKAEAENLKAILSLNLDAEGNSGKFFVENKGPAIAKDIYFSLAEDVDHNPLVGGDFEKKIPYPLLNPGEKYFFLASFPLSVTQMIYSVDLRWHTEDGAQHKKRFMVSR